jgi:hypothetical protein
LKWARFDKNVSGNERLRTRFPPVRANLAFAVLFYASVKSKVSLPILARLGRKCDNSGCLADYFVRRKLFIFVSVNKLQTLNLEI